MAPVREAIPRRRADAVIPLSHGQEQIWLHAQLAPDAPLYTESLTIRRRGPLDRELFVACLHDLVRRHEIWRTTFAWTGDRPEQRIHAEARARIRCEDLRGLPPPEREGAALRLAAADLREPFDLAREPGVRMLLATLDDEDHRLYLCLHHLVFDGISIYHVFLPELVALYESRLAGAPQSGGVAEPPLQYADFACWQRDTEDEVESARLVEYWRTQLAGAPALVALPTDRPRPAGQSFRAGLVRFGFAAPLTAEVRRVAHGEGCTPFMLLLGSFAAALQRWSGQTDLSIGTVSGGRDRPELDRLIGYFLRTLALRIDLGGNPSFREVLRRVRETLIGALCHDALPFQRVVQAVAPPRALDRSPLFQVTFSIEPLLPPLGPGWDLTEMDAGATASKFDLSIELEDVGEVIRGRAIYSRDLFEAATIAGFVARWTALLGQAVSDPGRRVLALGEHG
ncbi:MAG TPA: condensation domain-containing protein [Gemmatimonadales bacterium]|nr:condensation domain-containing protein [Gemmatimonadales bacterium]